MRFTGLMSMLVAAVVICGPQCVLGAAQPSDESVCKTPTADDVSWIISEQLKYEFDSTLLEKCTGVEKGGVCDAEIACAEGYSTDGPSEFHLKCNPSADGLSPEWTLTGNCVSQNATLKLEECDDGTIKLIGSLRPEFSSAYTLEKRKLGRKQKRKLVSYRASPIEVPMGSRFTKMVLLSDVTGGVDYKLTGFNSNKKPDPQPPIVVTPKITKTKAPNAGFVVKTPKTRTYVSQNITLQLPSDAFGYYYVRRYYKQQAQKGSKPTFGFDKKFTEGMRGNKFYVRELINKITDYGPFEIGSYRYSIKRSGVTFGFSDLSDAVEVKQ
eukprot:941578_1